MSLPDSSSSQASMVSISSSQLPLGGFHAFAVPLAGGLPFAAPFLRRLAPAGAGPPVLPRGRFLPDLARPDCSMIVSLPPWVL
jgi:hypothetical protein